MNEEPKSIWKKSWTGWGWLWAWLVLVVATFFSVLVVTLLIPGGSRNLGATMGSSAAISVVAIVFVGLLVFIHWVWSWRNFKRLLFGLACLATLIALIYAEEDWRSWHAWNKFKHEWEAKGEKFDFKDFVPSPVPDDQNFAMSPVWIAEERYNFLNTPKRAEAWYGNRIYSEEVSKILPLLPVSVSGLVGTNWWSIEWSPNFPKVSGQWATASLTDLKPWQAYYRGFEKTNPAAEISIASQPQSPAADVLLALSKFDPVIEQLRQDSARPYSRFPLGYDDENKAMIMLPHLAAVKRYSQVSQLRAIAELQAGQSEKALDDVKLMLSLNQSIRTEPILISHLVRIAMAAITLQPIYEGLAEHKWSDAQLAELDTELAKLDFLADYEFSMRGEMIFGISETEYLRRSRNFQALDYSENGSHNSSASHLGFRLAPASFFYWNELTIAQMHERWTLPMVDLEKRVASPGLVQRNNDAANKALNHFSPYNILARMIFPAVTKAVTKYVREQSSVDLARVAIALERYRLAHGEYPASLDVLVPQFMEKVPHDIINGQPLHYRRTSDPSSQSSDAASGQFILYSVGWNEKDDGGVVVFQKGSQPRDESPQSKVDINQGDWVWRYPAK